MAFYANTSVEWLLREEWNAGESERQGKEARSVWICGMDPHGISQFDAHNGALRSSERTPFFCKDEQ